MMSTSLNQNIIKSARKTYHTKNTCVIASVMFYENKKTIMFKIVGEIIYSLYYRYICLDYLCQHKYKLSNHIYDFKNTTFGAFSGIGIRDLLTRIMSCHNVSGLQYSNVTLTLWCKIFLIALLNNLVVKEHQVERYYWKCVPLEVKRRINTIENR